MYTFLIILTIIICIALSFFVLIQNPKGGGLDASFGGVSNNTFGAAQTTDFLEKATWGLAGALVIISIASTIFLRSDNTSSDANDLLNAPVQQQQAPAQEVPIGDDIAPINEQN